MEKKNAAIIALRLGLAFAFLYPAIVSLIAPTDWIGFAPRVMQDMFGRENFLTLFSILEILVGISILVMSRPFFPLLAAVAILGGVIYFNLGSFDLVFRDVSIIAMAVALLMLTKRHS